MSVQQEKGSRRESERDTVWRKARFLTAYRRDGIISTAAKAAGIGRQTHYDWIATDKYYAQDCEWARQEANEAIEAEIRRRATRKKAPSDTLLIFLAKKLNPEFRDNYKVELGNAGGVSLSLDVHFVDPPDATGEG